MKISVASAVLLATGANAYSSFTQSRTYFSPRASAVSGTRAKRAGVSSLVMEGKFLANTHVSVRM